MFISLALAASITFNGNFMQGGLVRIDAPQAAEISLDGEKIPGFNGKYYIGFGRDAAPNSTLTVKNIDGSTEQLNLPIEQRKYEVQNIENVDQGKVTPDTGNQKRIEQEALQIGATRMLAEHPCPGNLEFTRPADGLVTGWFGSQRIYNGTPKAPHSGVDFKGDVGSPAFAPESGVVIYTENMFLTGNTMVIDHGCGITSTFLHLNKFIKKPGDIVTKGEKVAEIGKTGLATGPHLHWNINIGATRLDGLLLVK